MTTLGWLLLIAGLFTGGFAFFVLAGILRERHEDRAAAWEFRRTGTPRTFRVDLPCMEAGSWHRAAPRVIRSGPQYPLDVAVPVRRERVLTAATPGGGIADVQPVLAERHPPATTSVPGLGKTVRPDRSNDAHGAPQGSTEASPCKSGHGVRTGDDSLPGTGTPDGRSRPLAASETSIDMDAGLLELLTCEPDQLDAAAERYWQRFYRRSCREVAAYLTGLAEVVAS